MKPLLIGIAGAGKIAREQHIPAIQQSSTFRLVACSHCSAPVDGVANFGTLDEMLSACPDLEAVVVCAPPQAHYGAARVALEHGKHVLLEKPPCATVMELDHLAQLASRVERTLFQTWHFRHAPGVEQIQRWLMSRIVRSGTIVWKEDVRQWHPQQAWLWQPDGFGVLDPGINALSILTQIVSDPVLVRAAELYVPSNCDTPIAANATLLAGEAEIAAEFDFRHDAKCVWVIEVETNRGNARLEVSRNLLTIDGEPLSFGLDAGEYPSLYRRFDWLIRERRSEVDSRPLKLVADMFLVGRRHTVEPFNIA